MCSIIQESNQAVMTHGETSFERETRWKRLHLFTNSARYAIIALREAGRTRRDGGAGERRVGRIRLDGGAMRESRFRKARSALRRERTRRFFRAASCLFVALVEV
jgi:hypothetical protein